MAQLRRWRVASGVIERDGEVLLVENLRRNGSTDWSTPGGVVEHGEASVHGLGREVQEETGLVVSEWSGPIYRVTTVAPDMGWHLEVEVFLAQQWSGELITGNDPDGIVIRAEYAAPDLVIDRLASTAQWVREPLGAWLTERWTGERAFAYELRGSDRATSRVTRTS